MHTQVPKGHFDTKFGNYGHSTLKEANLEKVTIWPKTMIGTTKVKNFNVPQKSGNACNKNFI